MGAKCSPTHDVFLSYSSQDKSWADAACSVLERHRVRCWIAPRDITPGDEWGAAIIKGINGSRVMVLIFSGHANASGQVHREVERAISRGMSVLPVRIEDVLPEGAMEYALGNMHWLDAFTPPVERQMERLARSVKTLLGDDVPTAAAPAQAKPFAVAPAPRWTRAPWLIAIAASLFGLVALSALMITIITGKGRAKTTVADDVPISAKHDDGVAVHRPAGRTDSSSTGAPKERAEAAPQNWVSLFNAKDLAGWMTHPSQPGNWRVQNGIIVGSGPDDSHIYTERGDYRDFHLLVEAKINDGGNSGVYFRASSRPVQPVGRPVWPEGYEAQINSTNWNQDKTGSLRVSGPPVTVIRDSPVPPGQWFILEVIAKGNHIVITVNGKTTTDYTDQKRRYSSGHIALQKAMRSTVVEFRKIEIKELSETREQAANPTADSS
jgi:hypothetical protein